MRTWIHAYGHMPESTAWSKCNDFIWGCGGSSNRLLTPNAEMTTLGRCCHEEQDRSIWVYELLVKELSIIESRYYQYYQGQIRWLELWSERARMHVRQCRLLNKRLKRTKTEKLWSLPNRTSFAS